MQRHVSLREVAEATGLSTSFLSAVERGKSDIALGRLARLAAYFDHDIGSLLGYTQRQARPHFIRDDNRLTVDRGLGIRSEVFRIPNTTLEVIVTTLEPETSYKDELTHDGVDVVLVTQGAVVATVAGLDYVIKERECAIWAGGYRHRLSNPFDETATVVGVVTENVF